MASRKLIEQLAVTAELCGSQMSPAAARAFAEALEKYPEDGVLKALSRCAREVSGRLSLAHVIARIDDGRPTADEAWAQVGTTDENVTFVTTTEAMEALGAVRLLMDQGDLVAARMGFKAAYERIVTDRRAQGVPTKQHVSLGWDKPGRVRVLTQAVQAGRLDANYAGDLLGVPAAELMGQVQPRLAARAPVAALVGQIAKSSGPPPCGAEGCDGWTHGESGPRCPQWGGEGR